MRGSEVNLFQFWSDRAEVHQSFPTSFHFAASRDSVTFAFSFQTWAYNLLVKNKCALDLVDRPLPSGYREPSASMIGCQFLFWIFPRTKQPITEMSLELRHHFEVFDVRRFPYGVTWLTWVSLLATLVTCAFSFLISSNESFYSPAGSSTFFGQDPVTLVGFL